MQGRAGDVASSTPAEAPARTVPVAPGAPLAAPPPEPPPRRARDAAVGKGQRFAEVMRILLRNELKDMVKQAALGRFANTDLHPAAAQFPARVRRILEELGPTFIKIGQLLGTRPDIVPAPFIQEFQKLYDATSPTPFAEARAVVEDELGRPLEELFASFDPEPLASASIGQVHRARLRDGSWVAVKVQHPGIEERLRTDFELLKGIVDFTEKVFAASRVWQPGAHLREIEGMLERELDYAYEAHHQRRIHEAMGDEPDVVIPRVHAALSTRRVLTMEFVEGRKLTQLTRGALPPADATRVARLITESMARQIFVDRLFHADPSPGNILVLPGARVAFLDFGAVGQVTRRRSRLILRLIQGLARGDVDETGRAIMELCDVQGEVDAKRYAQDVERLLDVHERQGASLADPVLLQRILDLARTHRMLLPPDFMLITRALYQFEGVCRTLDPDYELVEVLTPFAQRLQREQVLSPERQAEAFAAALGDYAALARDLPHALGAVLRKVEKDELTVNTRVVGQRERHRHQRSLVRMGAFTALLAAFLVGVAVLLAAGAASQVPTLAAVGAGVLLVWLLVVLFGSESMRGR